METNDTYQPIVKQLKRYFETRYKLFKLEAIAKGSTAVASTAADLAVVLIFIVAFVFLTLTLGFFLGKLFRSSWAGFGCITLLYLLIAFLNKAFRRRIEKGLVRILIRKMMRKKKTE
ncbi:phage holin family protein [Mucilaginibacter flavus]|uniref:phage holin family protein n=1 Tax=Mucilaginibacter flavus TaxID=931504 RepID=UPI0025B3BE4B|nr:phage holin family protein [Mucilaginibacter flavus]MDN3583151.1 phage holin family protein [Mucilaginibacter flavus]